MKTGKFLGVALAWAAVLALAVCDDTSGPKAGDTTVSPSGIALAWVPPGSFQMGSPVSEPNREPWNPGGELQHQVTLTKGFWMGVYPVTQGQYNAVIGSNPSAFTSAPGGGSRDSLPVEMVTWFDAVEFCNKLSESEGLQPAYAISDRSPATGHPITNATVTLNPSATGYCLPTEAQWEYACRAGTTTPFGIGDGTKMLGGMANFYDQYTYDLANDPPGHKNEGAASASYVGQTSVVGNYAANKWGLHDMHGNVWEWCWDWYGKYPSAAQTDPAGAVSGGLRVLRGGSWGSSVGQHLRSALRVYTNPYRRDDLIGFRLVRP